MKINSIELMSSEWITPRLITWFNSQSAADRTIPSNQLYLIKVTILTTVDGTPVFVVGVDSSATDPVATGREYIGDATFLWVGVTDIPATAAAASFFEVAKSVQPYVNIIPYTLTIHEGSILPYTLVINELALPV